MGIDNFTALGQNGFNTHPTTKTQMRPRTDKNRLIKAAMAECMADNNGLPTGKHNNIYREWGNGDWGMIITGMSALPLYQHSLIPIA